MYASFLGNGRPSAVLCKNLATIHMQDGLCGYGYIHSYPRKICAYGIDGKFHIHGKPACEQRHLSRSMELSSSGTFVPWN